MDFSSATSVRPAAARSLTPRRLTLATADVRKDFLIVGSSVNVPGIALGIAIKRNPTFVGGGGAGAPILPRSGYSPGLHLRPPELAVLCRRPAQGRVLQPRVLANPLFAAEFSLEGEFEEHGERTVIPQ